MSSSHGSKMAAPKYGAAIPLIKGVSIPPALDIRVLIPQPVPVMVISQECNATGENTWQLRVFTKK